MHRAHFALLSAAAAGFLVPAAALVADPVPDFALVDHNKTSPRYNQTVSPRDYLYQVSAYYFGSSI